MESQDQIRWTQGGIHNGNALCEAVCGGHVRFQSSGPAVIRCTISKDQTKEWLVSGRTTDRAFDFFLPWETSEFTVEADDAVLWNYAWLARKPGFEQPDPTPVALPIGYQHPPTLQQEIQTYIRDYFVRQGDENSPGDFEEEDDFDDDFDDIETSSPYQLDDSQERAPRRRAKVRDKVDGEDSSNPTAEPAAPKAEPKVKGPSPDRKSLAAGEREDSSEDSP